MTTDDGDRDLVDVMREYIAAREVGLAAMQDILVQHRERAARQNEHAVFHQIVEQELRDAGCR